MRSRHRTDCMANDISIYFLTGQKVSRSLLTELDRRLIL